MKPEKPNFFGMLLNKTGNILIIGAFLYAFIGLVNSGNQNQNSIENLVNNLELIFSLKISLIALLSGIAFKIFGKILILLVDIKLILKNEEHLYRD